MPAPEGHLGADDGLYSGNELDEAFGLESSQELVGGILRGELTRFGALSKGERAFDCQEAIDPLLIFQIHKEENLAKGRRQLLI